MNLILSLQAERIIELAHFIDIFFHLDFYFIVCSSFAILFSTKAGQAGWRTILNRLKVYPKIACLD